MSNANSKEPHSGVFKRLFMMLSGLVILVTAGCGPGSGDGTALTGIVLPTDRNLVLPCVDAGIFRETCIQDDPANPFRFVTIIEFDVNNPGAQNKFDLAGTIPPGPTGAKARFYFWATALARRSNGENQWYTAQALHELWSAQTIKDPLVREQALKAYKSVLDNYFGSATFFGPFPDPVDPTQEVFIAIDLVKRLGTFVIQPPPGMGAQPDPGYDFLFPGDTPDRLRARFVLAEWGYFYSFPATADTEGIIVPIN